MQFLKWVQSSTYLFLLFLSCFLLLIGFPDRSVFMFSTSLLQSLKSSLLLKTALQGVEPEEGRRVCFPLLQEKKQQPRSWDGLGQSGTRPNCEVSAWDRRRADLWILHTGFCSQFALFIQSESRCSLQNKLFCIRHLKLQRDWEWYKEPQRAVLSHCASRNVREEWSRSTSSECTGLSFPTWPEAAGLAVMLRNSCFELEQRAVLEWHPSESWAQRPCVTTCLIVLEEERTPELTDNHEEMLGPLGRNKEDVLRTRAKCSLIMSQKMKLLSQSQKTNSHKVLHYESAAAKAKWGILEASLELGYENYWWYSRYGNRCVQTFRNWFSRNWFLIKFSASTDRNSIRGAPIFRK